MANDFHLLPVSGTLAYTWDFSDEVPSTSPLTTVTAIDITTDTGTSPSAITIGTQTDDLGNARTTVLLSGTPHGGVYVVQAIATLSNGEEIPKDITLQVFNA